MAHRTSLYILTGFLGSGKTTVLTSLLHTLQGKKVGVIQNEFGKRSIDGEILKEEKIPISEIDRGSIFCSCLKLSFVKSLCEMAARELDCLFVESSGLGDPSNVDEILAAVDTISDQGYDFKGVLCVVDALHFLQQVANLETVSRQLKHCNLAILSKTDLVSKEQLDLVQAEIRRINPVCPLLLSSDGRLDAGFLLEDLQQYRWASCEETTNTEENRPKTLIMELQADVPQEGLLQFLHNVSPSLYRVKGFAQITGRGICRVDLVGQQADIHASAVSEETELVLISRIGPKIIPQVMDAWKKYVGSPMRLRN